MLSIANNFIRLSRSSSLIALVVLLQSACSEKPSIQTYTIPSEYDGPIVTWTLPDNWGENPDLSGPMAGSFHVKTTNGPQGRIGVMPFRESVSTVDVANMFSREMGLPAFDEDSIKAILESKQIGERTFEWLRLTEADSSLNSRTALLALLRKDGETWLFPFIADEKLVNQEIANFSSFLSSCTLRSAVSKPIVAKSVNKRIPVSNSPKQKVNPWTWNIPPTWNQGKQSSVRVGSFSVNDSRGNKLDISITSFPGDVGGLLANVNRWIGQIDLKPIDQSNIDKYCSPIQIDGKKSHFVEAYGDEKGILAGILFQENKSWFFKLIGDRDLVETEKSTFMTFLESVRSR